MAAVLSAVRYALRQFRLAPVFTAAAILTLSVGIGGTTAIFTLIHGVMLRSLPVTDPERLYRIGDGSDCCVQGGPQDRWGLFSYPLFERLVAEAPEFEQVAAFQASNGRLGGRRAGVDPAPRPLRTQYVTGNYFTTLGVRAFGGRVFTADDDRPSASPVVVISHHLWTTEYGSDPALVGGVLVIESQPFTVAGIAPPGFFGETLRANPPDVWIPLQHEPLLTNNQGLLRAGSPAWLRAIGRLRPGASADALGPRLTGVLRQWIEHDSGYPANWMPDIMRRMPQQTLAVVPAGGGVEVMQELYRESLQILFVVCSVVLLVACANVANLLLARAMSRRTQTAVRLAVGASRRHLVTQALVESVLLSIFGAALGLVVAIGAARLLLALAFSSASVLPIDTTPSPLALAFAFGVATVTGIIFGTVPAWFATRTQPIEALRGGARTVGDRSSIARTTLLVVQATLSVILVSGAALLGRSLGKLESQDLGYTVEDRVIVQLNRPPATYSDAKLASLYRALEERLSRLPGVQGAGLALYNPLTDNWGELIQVAGHPPSSINAQAGASWDRVSANYLQDVGATLVRGRGFTRADVESTTPVAVVTEAFARRFFASDEDPIGRRFGLATPENMNTFEIVGIVRDLRWSTATLRRGVRPMFFVPLAQQVEYAAESMRRLERASHMIGGLMLVTKMPVGTLEPQLVKAVAEVDSNLTIISIRRMGDQLALSFDQERAVASIAGLFGLVSLILAAIGLYGITSYSVAQRTNEIGVRMALGADGWRVVRLVLHSALARVGLGLLLGIPLAIGAGKLIATRLYGVAFWDPVALSMAAGAMLLAALIAALIPAGRASSIPPLIALRTE